MLNLFTKTTQQQLGNAGEQQALHYLKNQGLKLLAQNFRCQGGELDLIMLSGDTVVVVEVRARSSTQFGGAAASVTHTKQRKIIHATEVWLMTHPHYQHYAIRFDVVTVEPPNTLHWVTNAFTT